MIIKVCRQGRMDNQSTPIHPPNVCVRLSIELLITNRDAPKPATNVHMISSSTQGQSVNGFFFLPYFLVLTRVQVFSPFLLKFWVHLRVGGQPIFIDSFIFPFFQKRKFIVYLFV